jgi:hypothetical protein
MEKEKVIVSTSSNTIKKYNSVRNHLPTPTPTSIPTPIHSPTCSGMFLTNSL